MSEVAGFEEALAAFCAGQPAGTEFKPCGWYVPTLDRVEVFLSDEPGVMEEGAQGIVVRVDPRHPRKVLGFAIERFSRNFGEIVARDLEGIAIERDSKRGALALTFRVRRGPAATFRFKRNPIPTATDFYGVLDRVGDVDVPISGYTTVGAGA